jgi:hypothetical protein
MGTDRRVEPRLLGFPLTPLDAFHLPALPALPTTTWTFPDGVEIRIAQLTPAALSRQVDGLIEAGEQLVRGRSVESIVTSVGRAAERLLDRSDPLRVAAETALPAITGASPPMIRTVLDRMAADWRADRLRNLLDAEFVDPQVLERFRPRRSVDGIEARAIGPRLTTHFFSGNVPGVAVTSLIRAALVRSPSLGKTAVGEPLLPALFARALAEVDPQLGAALAVAYWSGGDQELEGVALERAEAVIAYGGNDAIRAIRERVPAHARFLAYGHRVSFGMVARERLTREGAAALAAGAAQDIATFDQQGCVSPHLFYVEEGGETSAAGWAELLAGALADAERQLPRGRLSPSESSAIRQLRGEMEFAQLAGRGVVLHASPEGTSWTVILDLDPTFEASCLNRTVRVKPVSSLEQVPALAARVGPLLQTVGLAAPPERALAMAEALGRIGASRIAHVGEMAWPPPHWLHDGRPPLADLVRWVDRSTGG